MSDSWNLQKRRGDGRREGKRRGELCRRPPPCHLGVLAVTPASLLSFPSLLLGPEEIGWWRRSRRRRRRRKDERILKLWVDMEIRSWKGKKRNDEKQMESAVDMTASSLESADLPLVQLHGCICIYMIPQNVVTCWDLSLAQLCVCLVCARVRVCKHIHNIR